MCRFLFSRDVADIDPREWRWYRFVRRLRQAPVIPAKIGTVTAFQARCTRAFRADSRIPPTDMKSKNIAACLTSALALMALSAGLALAAAGASEDYDPTRLPAAPAAALMEVQKPAPAKPGVKSFLWEVKSPGNTIWLFGTMHVGKPAFYPLPEAVEAALDRSKWLVVEADVGSPAASGDMDALISYVPPDTLDKHLPKGLYERLKTQLARLQIPEAAVRPMKAFVVAGFLSVAEFSRLGYDMNLGVDGYLLKRARDAGKQVAELESVRMQLEMLERMPPDLQEAFIDNAITMLELGRSADRVTGMVNAWQSGDTRLMEDVSEDVNRGMKKATQLDEVLLHGRHPAMLQKVEGFLAAKEPHFVAVGSLHLVGPRGLVQALKAKGYEVTQK
jgi:uncharacterized protein YbaP (TraB family)